MIAKKKLNKNAIIAYCLFDWGNSAFSTLILTFIFATYFTTSVAKNKILGTAQWGDTVAISGIIIAVLSPILGAIADHEGRRKPWLACFSILCIIPTALLWYVKPSPEYVTFALTNVIIGAVGLEVGMVFYNALLRDIAPRSHIGRVSGWAWGAGYLGGLACLLVALLLFVNGSASAWFGFNTAADEQIRVSGPLTAVWFSIFALPLFIFVPDRPSTKIGFCSAIKKGLTTLYYSLTSLKKYKTILLFLIAHMIYTDGLNTVFVFGGIYAAGTFHMDFSHVIMFGIAANIAAGSGAISFAWLDDYLGAKPTILIALAVLTISGLAIFLTKNIMIFWIFSMVLSTCVGPAQAASRSLMVRITPPELITEMFGLYALSGKVTAFIGPWLFGLATSLYETQRAGIFTILIFILVGASLLALVKVNSRK